MLPNADPDSKRAQHFEGIARRLVKSLRWATRSQATSVEAEPSKSRARRRHLPNPCKGTFDDPASRQKFEAFDTERPLDDLDGPWPAMSKCVDKLLASINPVGKDVLQLGKALSQAFQQRDGAMDILNIGGRARERPARSAVRYADTEHE
jgi:hypothetical protein